MKMKLEAELLRVGGYLLEYIGGDSCKSSVKYDFLMVKIIVIVRLTR